MPKKKKSLHCGRCGSEAMFYKKGRKHRVLVCPTCGILATNPLPLAALAAAALPTVIETGSKLLSKPSKASEGNVQRIVTDSLDKPNKGERYVKMALGD